jgi:hypothetical protein
MPGDGKASSFHTVVWKNPREWIMPKLIVMLTEFFYVDEKSECSSY